MYCAFSEETLEVLSQRESIRRQLASETGTGELFITDFSRKNQLRIPNFLDFFYQCDCLMKRQQQHGMFIICQQPILNLRILIFFYDFKNYN